MKIIVVTKERRIIEVNGVEFYDYEVKTKTLRYFKDYVFQDLPNVEILHCKEEK